MANKKLFKSTPTITKAPPADTTNRAGGKAYSMEKRHALAQLAATNCFNGTFYASAEDNLKLAVDAALALTDDPQFLAKVAFYSRTKNGMKDMPAFLMVMLAQTDTKLFRKLFPKVIDNAKMLRNFCQIARSGQTGRTFNLSAGTCRHAINGWFTAKSPHSIFNATVGNDPKLADIIRMARPTPNSPEKSALLRYILEKPVEFDSLPEIVRQYDLYKRTKTGTPPDVDFRLLDSLGLDDAAWCEVARNAKWQMTRMNLNTFARHNVFKNRELIQLIADRLRNADEIHAARQFPYQLYMAYKATCNNTEIPSAVSEALQDAMEIAIDNVPEIKGRVLVAVDSSGSMGDPITGSSGYGKPSSVRCVDVAGLIASAVLRKNRAAEIWTFNNDAVRVMLNPRDTVITNTNKLARAGGGTNISAPIRKWNAAQEKADVIIYVSDYESWIDSGYSYSWYGDSTALQTEWQTFQKRSPKAKLICCDLTPRTNSQAVLRPNILQVGGFSDEVFNVMSTFVEGGNDSDHWLKVIEAVSLD